MHQFRLILRPIAVVLVVQSIFMALCGVTAIFWEDYGAVKAFFLTCVFAMFLALVFNIIAGGKKSRGHISVRSGFLLVSLIWVVVSLAGCLPYMLSGALPNFPDAFFESMSGFTTTGATVMSDIELMPKSILLWRAFTHWLGGGGIIVMSVAILPLLGIGGMQMMKAESSGVVREKLTPRITQTAKYVWIYYISATVVCTGLLIYGGMDVFDAVCHAFSALSTGGLSPKNASVAYYQSAFAEWVLIGAMLLGSVNFFLLLRVLRGNLKSPLRDTEFKAFIMIFLVASAVVTYALYNNGIYGSWLEALRYGAFQVASIYSTTGFATADYETWPLMAQGVIFILFFIGGCSGSTSGGVKVVRYVIMIRQALCDLRSLVHPNGVFTVRLNNVPVASGIIKSVMGYFILYILTILTVTFLLASGGHDLLTSFTAALGTIGTVGPGFGAVGPSSTYASFQDWVKIVLSFNMLLGRLEIYTFLVILTPWFWKR